MRYQIKTLPFFSPSSPSLALKRGVFVFLNGKIIPEPRAVVSVFDRSFLYGDGLFETMHVCNGRPFRWEQHLRRLQNGAALLKIKLPFTSARLHQFATTLVKKNRMPDSLLRLTLSRGVGIRGYSPKGADRPVLVMSLHPMPATPASSTAKSRRAGPEAGAPVNWSLVTSAYRLPAGEPLARFKTCNKLSQVMARAEADAAGANEALLLNTDGDVVEGAASNLFWIEGRAVCTPPLAAGILSGVTRAVVIEICRKQKIAVREKNITPKELMRMDGVFLSLSSFGIVEATVLDGEKLNRSPLVGRLAAAYDELLARESRG